jgi:lysylphosphatidylglycerol synthetase-like protein (DUF2156 family)
MHHLSATPLQQPSIGRMALIPLACGAVLALAGYFPTRNIAGEGGLRAMGLALLLVSGVVYVTLLPAMRMMRGKAPAARFNVALGAGVVRMMLTVPLAALLAWQRAAEPKPLLIWVAIGYIVMIKAETLALIRWSRQLGTTA